MCVGLVNIVAGSRQEQMPQVRDQFDWGSNIANPDATPISENVESSTIGKMEDHYMCAGHLSFTY